MRLNRLRIDRLPGIDSAFWIEPDGDGIHVIHGPNAIGKSSICRAVECLYWSDRGPRTGTFVTGEFDLDGTRWQASRDGPHLRWKSADEAGIPSALPASHTHRCFFLRLRDLIDPSPDGTRDIASEIRRQMSGGFDLVGIEEAHFPDPGKRPGRQARNAFNEAARGVQNAEGAQLALQRRVDELKTLEARRDAAVKDERRLPCVQRAFGLAGREQEHVAGMDGVATCPDALANLTGNELDEIEVLQKRSDALSARIHAHEGERDAARGAMRESRLEMVIAPADLSVWRQKADDLTRIELELQDAQKSLGARRREMEQALAAIGDGNEDVVDLDLGNHGELFEFLRAAEKHRMAKAALESRIHLLGNLQPGKESLKDPETLRVEIDLLRRWLRAPGKETLRQVLQGRLIWILGALAAAIAGTVLALSVDPQFGHLAAAGSGSLLAVLLLPGRTASREREVAEGELAKQGIDVPKSTGIGEAETRLHKLESELTSIEARLQRVRDRDVERHNLKSELDKHAEAEPLLDERRTALVEKLRLDAMRPDVEIVDLASALDRFRRSRIEYEGAAGGVEQLQARHAGLLSDLALALREHGEPAPEGAASAKAHLGTLSDRSALLAKAREDERRAIGEVEKASAERSATTDAIAAVYGRASIDIGNLPALAALLQRLPAYRGLIKSVERLESQIRLDRDELARAGEGELADCDRLTLERLRDRLASASHQAETFRNEIADIRARANEARQGSSLQDLMAEVEKARAALKDRRDETLLAGAGRFLIDRVEQEFEKNQMPRVLERARRHFSDFTHHGYELRLARDTRHPCLFAIDLGNGRERELDELSDGTRAQLLLAARLAFAEEVERGTKLPLFLDEALDQSDPARFDAIASSLGRIAHNDGRQIFYLTSDPLDAERIRRAFEPGTCGINEIDLGDIRGTQHGIKDGGRLKVPPKPQVPSPHGLSVEEYGILLSVPPFSPAHGWRAQHLFYVLSDDPELLHAFLAHGISQAGQWRSVSASTLGGRLGSRSMAKEDIDSRIDLLEIFCEAWTEGRIRPIGRDALEQSRAISKRYLETVITIAGELGGDPQRLLEELRSKRRPLLAGFRRASADALETWLVDQGHLDERPILDADELTLRALASPPANRLPEGDAGTCLVRWWTWATSMQNG